ncbi:MAG: hypothetical protein H8F28_23760 [Fibrella sp.]|nr:hypothetical protein [Armatimonadota bacterium]
MFTTNFLGRNSAQIERLEAKIATQESDRAVLIRDLGTCDPQEIIARVRALENEVASAARTAASATTPTPAPAGENDPILLTSPRELMEKIRSFNNRIQDLNSTVAGMEAQLVSLYEEKEGMERQIGAGDLEGILGIIQGYRVMINNMEQQLMTMYAARETLESEMGTSDAHRIVALFRGVSALVGQIQDQMNSVEMPSLPAVSKTDAGLNGDLPRVIPAIYDVVPAQRKPVVARSEESTTGTLPRFTPVTASTPVAAPVTSIVATPAVIPTPFVIPAMTAEVQRSINPAVAAAAAAFATAAAASAASAAAIMPVSVVPATGREQLPPDHPDYDPLSNPNDPLNDDSLINGTP